MPRKQSTGTRTLKELYLLADQIGVENVDCSDAEVGILLTGGATPLTASTIANKRSRGDFPFRIHYGRSRQPLTAMSEVLAYRNRHAVRKSA